MATRPSSRSRDTRQQRTRRWRWGALGLGCFLASLALAWFVRHRSPEAQPTLDPGKIRFDFERGAAGWTKEPGSPGCIGVGPSREVAYAGEASLQIQMYLDGDDPERQSAEVWVDVKPSSPQRARPIDLTGRTIVAWVYAPEAAVGDPERPNGFQLFAKDDRYQATFGQWQNAEPDRWVRLKLHLRSDPLATTDLVPGFRPDRIVLVGLKMALGDRSRAIFDGSVYLDSVGW